MPRNRSSVLKSMLLGFLVAVLFTLIAMLALAAALVFFRLADATITLLNQFVKFFAVILGVCAAVPRGSQRGFATGLTLSMFYIAIGYILYVLLGGAGFHAANMLGELLLGSAIGAMTGAIRANLPARRRAAGL